MLMGQNRIPYRISGGTSFFSRPEIKDLLAAYLRVLTNPEDDSAFPRIVNTPRPNIRTNHYSRNWVSGRIRGIKARIRPVLTSGWGKQTFPVRDWRR